MTTFTDAQVLAQPRSRAVPQPVPHKLFVVPTVLVLALTVLLALELDGVNLGIAFTLLAGAAVRVIGEVLFHARAALLGMASYLFAAPVLLVGTEDAVAPSRGVLEALAYYLPLQVLFLAVAVVVALRRQDSHLVSVTTLTSLAALPLVLVGSGVLELYAGLSLSALLAAPAVGWGFSRLWRGAVWSGWIALLVICMAIWGGFRSHQSFDAGVGVAPSQPTAGGLTFEAVRS